MVQIPVMVDKNAIETLEGLKDLAAECGCSSKDFYSALHGEELEVVSTILTCLIHQASLIHKES